MLFCFVAEMLFQDASTYNYLSNGMLPVSGVDDASDLQDSLVSQSYVLQGSCCNITESFSSGGYNCTCICL